MTESRAESLDAEYKLLHDQYIDLEAKYQRLQDEHEKLTAEYTEVMNRNEKRKGTITSLMNVCVVQRWRVLYECMWCSPGV